MQSAPGFPRGQLHAVTNRNHVGPSGHQSSAQASTPDADDRAQQTKQLSRPQRNMPAQSRHYASVAEYQNTSVWLTGLPQDIDLPTLLGGISTTETTGKIFSTVLHGPNSASGHANIAAKITFFNRRGAVALQRAIREGQLIFENQPDPNRRHTRDWLLDVNRWTVPNFAWNRSPAAPGSGTDPSMSRVILIAGPKEVVNYKVLGRIFANHFEFDTEYVRSRGPRHGGMATLEWAFGSVPGQAKIAVSVLRAMFPGIVGVQYTADPCDWYNN